MVSRLFENVPRCFENVSRYYEMVSRLFEKVPRYFENVSRLFEKVNTLPSEYISGRINVDQSGFKELVKIRNLYDELLQVNGTDTCRIQLY